jgi:hypothetical protein
MSKRVTRIDELAQNVPPPRDLWPAISAAIEADRAGTGAAAAPARRRVWMPAAGMAAAVALVAIGVVIGMGIQPQGGQTVADAAKNAAPAAMENLFPAAFGDQKYRMQRAALMLEVQNRLKTMTPAERHKVQGSLDTLQKSIAEIEAALGKDPANALLQELFVNSCQEEMRALTAVRDSGSQES